jgi:hypothetical protein
MFIAPLQTDSKFVHSAVANSCMQCYGTVTIYYDSGTIIYYGSGTIIYYGSGTIIYYGSGTIIYYGSGTLFITVPIPQHWLYRM